MKTGLMICAVLTLAACDTFQDMKRPSASGNASRMSADTLCYRAAYNPRNQTYKEEIEARDLDCDAILSDLSQPTETRL